MCPTAAGGGGGGGLRGVVVVVSLFCAAAIVASSGAVAAANNAENAGRLLGKAGQELARLPFPKSPAAATIDHQIPAVPVASPKHEDLRLNRLRKKTIQIVQGLWSALSDPQRLAILKERGAAREILLELARLQGAVFSAGARVEATRAEAALRALTVSLSAEERAAWAHDWDAFAAAIAKVQLFYNIMDGFVTDRATVGDTALEDYASSLLSSSSTSQNGSDIEVALRNLHNIAIDHTQSRDIDRGLLSRSMRRDIYAKLYMIIGKKSESGGANAHLCSLGQSPHQVIYNLYNVIALTEIKGYTMIQFSYMMLRLYGKGNFTLESDLARRKFEAQTAEKLVSVKHLLPHLPRTFHRCDPPNQIDGTTYVRITELLQGVKENEADMHSHGSCKDNCASYTVAQSESCFKRLFCAKQRRCMGRLFDCQFFNADAWICMSQTSDRRYDWIEYEDGTLLGDKKDGQCVNKIKVDSWWRWIFWHCSYCMCKCDEPGPHSDRFWSLRASTANVTDNEIITGVRFAKRGRVVHLEAQKARARPEGSVDDFTRTWMSASPIDVDTAEQDTDFMMMSYEQRAFDTDRLQAPPGHVVTGVRLRNLGGHINLEIQVTPITFSSGRLAAPSATWIGNDNTPATANPRKQVDILQADVPTKFRGSSAIDTGNNEFVVFDASNVFKDVMQTTIPFIDIQPVAPEVGTWITGVGTYHKGHSGYGGYVGLLLETYDFSKHLVPERNSQQQLNEELAFDFGGGGL